MLKVFLTLFVALAGAELASSQEPVVWVASPWQHVLRTTKAGSIRPTSMSKDVVDTYPLPPS